MNDSFPKPVLAHTLATIQAAHAVERTIDAYDEILEDLFLIRNPRFKFAPSHEAEFTAWKAALPAELADGVWAYFPWNKIAVRILPEAEHFELRTARNKNLITKDEQERFYHARVAVAGLSVGSHGALTLALMGGARCIHLADPDVISGSNLNRIRYDYSKVGQNKAHVAAEYIYQLDPYADVVVLDQGVDATTTDAFLGGATPVDVLVEELDSLEMKIRLRIAAREKGIPVVMATDNGDGVVVDIERYDLDPKTELFNGALGPITIDDFAKFTPSDLPKLATKVAGPDLIVPRMLLSLKEVGTTLYSWPQLGDAATLSGVAIAYCVRKIVLGEPLAAGKLEINLDRVFDPTYESAAAQGERAAIRDVFKKAVGLA
jgi:tRNA threonylcarbamoyladenosine dehydratase